MKSFSLSKAFGLATALTQLQSGYASLLVDFNAQRGDNPSVLGLINLETVRNTMIPQNTADLYIKLTKDPKGVPAARCHRKEGLIRAEYHSLKGKTKADTTYFIGYTFSVGTIQNNLVVWQWKEYEVADQQNVPLNLELRNDILELNYQAPNTNSHKSAKWSTQLKSGVTYRAGIVINTSRTNGYVQLYWNGARQNFNDDGKSTQTLKGLFYPGTSDPKFGVYRGEETDIDSYIYNVQIGTTLDDIKLAAGLGSTPPSQPTSTLVTVTTPSGPSPTCSWEGHCLGAPCSDENDCSDDFVCKSGKCSKP